MAYAAGVDVGSTQTKAAIINENRELVGIALIDTGSNVVAAAENVFEKALKESGIANEEVEYVIGTGYGRYRVTFGNDQVTEISCHGRGAVHMFPNTRTVVDMGGQDTKAIKVGETGGWKGNGPPDCSGSDSYSSESTDSEGPWRMKQKRKTERLTIPSKTGV